MKLGLLIAAIVLIGIPVAGRIMQQDADQNPPTPADAAKTPGLEPPRLTAQSLENTQWSISIKGFPVTMTLLPGGQLKAEAMGMGQLSGTWSVSGADLTVSAQVGAQMQSQTAKISGDKILVNGKPVQRLR
jgi:hypothetical protein